eukprot:scaffold27211_cov63-Phaeocystis_antarctica.AAC.7
MPPACRWTRHRRGRSGPPRGRGGTPAIQAASAPRPGARSPCIPASSAVTSSGMRTARWCPREAPGMLAARRRHCQQSARSQVLETNLAVGRICPQQYGAAAKASEAGPRAVTIEPTIDPGSVGGDVGTVAGGFNRPGGSPGCYENGRIYMSDTGNHVIKSVDRGSGAVNTEAGKRGVKGLVDGRGGEAAFYNPQGVAVGPDGNCACPPRVASKQRPTGAHARPRARLQCTLPTWSIMHGPCTHHAHAMHVHHLLSCARRQCTLPT